MHMTQINQSKVSETKEITTTKKSLFDYIASYNFIYLCSFYIYLSGALYFYGYMGEIGFSGASLDSIFSPLIYSQVFLGEIFSKALLANLSTLLVFPLEISLIVTGLCVFFVIVYNCKVWKKLTLKPQLYLSSKKHEKPLIERKPVMSALFVFPIVYFSHLACFAVIVVLSAIVMIPLYFPYQMGSLSAQSFLARDEGEVCEKLSWDLPEYRNQKMILSCEKIPVDVEPGLVSGVIIHSDSKYMYMVTNEFLLRIKSGKVASCVSKQVNPNIKGASNHNEENDTPPHSEGLTCDQLLGVKKS